MASSTMSDHNAILYSRNISTKLKRKVCYKAFQGQKKITKKLGKLISEDERQFEKLTAAVVCCFPGEKTKKSNRIKKQPIAGLWISQNLPNLFVWYKFKTSFPSTMSSPS